MQELPKFSDIEAAAKRISGEAVVTPLLENAKLNALVGGRIFMKAECLQRTGSFKFRGAWNCISKLDPARSKGGVVAYSTGNHAQGVAAAAQLRGMAALIVMPEDTPEIKSANTKSYGAEIVTYDRATEDRAEIANHYVAKRGAVLVPPFEHADIIAGQGTCGLEIINELYGRNVELDDMLVNCGGGGLTAGVALAFSQKSPKTKVHSVEPEGFDDYARSLRSGIREKNARAAGSICDALLTPQPGEMTFAMNKGRLAEGYVVSEAEVRRAVRFAFETLKLVVEPGGAAGLAAVLIGKVAAKGKNIGIILSGGNVDPKLFVEILMEA
ncbi:MAG: threonine/serine dehydratase [Aestuariivirga sp.]|nr:threonine/serine dehydratase [Aestuariivirga sp.]